MTDCRVWCVIEREEGLIHVFHSRAEARKYQHQLTKGAVTVERGWLYGRKSASVGME